MKKLGKNPRFMVSSPYKGRLVRVANIGSLPSEIRWDRALKMLRDLNAEPIHIREVEGFNYNVWGLCPRNKYVHEDVYNLEGIGGCSDYLFARLGHPITRHGFVAIKGENPLIVINSPLLNHDLAREATRAMTLGSDAPR